MKSLSVWLNRPRFSEGLSHFKLAMTTLNILKDKYKYKFTRPGKLA